MQDWEVAVQAARAKKAEDLLVLDIGSVSSFTDHFLLCTGKSARQTQSIAEGIQEALKEKGVRAFGVEGHSHGEWILLDYGDFVAHIFTQQAREFYDLERLWRQAPRVPLPEAA